MDFKSKSKFEMDYYKLVFCGEFGVGKTSLMNMFNTGSYSSNTISTIGASFQNKYLPEHKMTIGMWDTAGQERFNSLLPLYFRNAHAVIYCWGWDIPFNAEIVEKFITEFRNHNETAEIFFVVTKRDLCPDKIVYLTDFERFCQDHHTTINYTSSKKNIGITELFESIIVYLKTINLPKNETVEINYYNRTNYCCYN